MLKWCWLVVGAAFSCSSPERRFSSSENQGGTAGQSVGAADGGRPHGGGAGSSAAGAEEATGGAAGASSTAGASSIAGAAGAADAAGAAGAIDGGDAGTAGQSGAGSGGANPTCAGCVIASACVEAGAKNPGNPCEICNVSRSRAAYSANSGAQCGSAASECSSQDTCDESGVCQKNDFAAGMTCVGGQCEAGVCRAVQNPFDCIVPSPPKANFTAEVFDFGNGTPPSPKGGTVTDGRYTASRIDLYKSDAVGVDIRTFEFKKGFVQIASQYYSLDQKVAYIPEVRFAGSFTGNANLLKFELERCDPQYDIGVPNLPYTATVNGLVTIVALTGGGTVVTSYVRQQ